MEQVSDVSPIDRASRNLDGMDFFLLWAGAAVSLAEIWAGGLLVPLGLGMGLWAVLLGHLLGNFPLGLGGIIGTRTGLPTMVLVRAPFGLYGSYFATLLNLIQLVGWTGVMLWIGGKAAEAVLPFPCLGFRGWIVVCGILTSLWAILGHAWWKWLHRIAVTGLLCLCLLMTGAALREYGWQGLLRIPAPGGMPFMLALDLVIAMPISWLALVADYSRYGKAVKPAFWGTWIGYFLVSSWMYALGLAAALATKSDTPDSMVIGLMVHLGMFLPALLIVLFSTFTTTFLDIYSAAVSAMNLRPASSERTGGLLCGGLGTLIALLLPATAYEGFLLFIGSVFCPLFGVVLAHYFLLKKGPETTRRLTPQAFAAWGAGVAVYLLMQHMTTLGASVPGMAAAGALYVLLMGGRKQISGGRGPGGSETGNTPSPGGTP